MSKLFNIGGRNFTGRTHTHTHTHKHTTYTYKARAGGRQFISFPCCFRAAGGNTGAKLKMKCSKYLWNMRIIDRVSVLDMSRSNWFAATGRSGLRNAPERLRCGSGGCKLGERSKVRTSYMNAPYPNIILNLSPPHSLFLVHATQVRLIDVRCTGCAEGKGRNYWI